MPSVRIRSLQLADTFFGQQIVYSPGCITARAGQVYSIGATVDFGFKYRLQLAIPDAESSVIGETEGAIEEAVEYGSSTNETPDVVLHDNTDSKVEYDDFEKSVQTSSEESLPPTSGVSLALYMAQVTLERRLRDYLQKKLIYCPGSGYDHRFLTIDGVAVDLLSYGLDECDYEFRPSCQMTGSITLYQSFKNAQSSSLQSIQASLESLRIGMNEENFFEDEDGSSIVNVEFLGGVIDIGDLGREDGRLDIPLDGIGDLGGGVAVASIIAPTQKFIQSQRVSLTHVGQGIVALFAMALLVLVVARRRKRARYARTVEESNDVDNGISFQSDEDSWTQDGYVTNETGRRNVEEEHNDEQSECVEVYLVAASSSFSQLFGWLKKRRSAETDHVSISGLRG